MDKKIFSFTGGKSQDLNKKWYAYWFDNNGKMQKSYKGLHIHKTLDARLGAMKMLVAELEGHKLEESKELSLSEKIDNAYSSLSFKRKNTQSSLLYSLNIFKGFLVDNKINLINESVAESYKLFLLKKYKPSAAKSHFSRAGTISGMLYGKKNNPFLTVSTGIAISKPAGYFQPSQIEKIKAYLSEKDPEMWLFVQVLFYCFIRPKEICSLKVGDVLMDEDKIYLSGDISKNKKSEYVWIPAPLKESLYQWLASKKETDYLFDRKGCTSSETFRVSMSLRHRKHLLALGIDTNKHSLYSWKHTGAVMCVKAGIKI